MDEGSVEKWVNILWYSVSQGAKQKLQRLEKKGKSVMAIRQIRQFDEDFDANQFAQEAQQIYIDTHEALIK